MTVMFIDYGHKKYQDSESKLLRIDLNSNEVAGWTDLTHPQYYTPTQIAQDMVDVIKYFKPEKLVFNDSFFGVNVGYSLRTLLTNDPAVNYQDGNLTYNV